VIAGLGGCSYIQQPSRQSGVDPGSKNDRKRRKRERESGSAGANGRRANGVKDSRAGSGSGSGSSQRKALVAPAHTRLPCLALTAPEVLAGGPADAQSTTWVAASLCCELLTGRPPISPKVREAADPKEAEVATSPRDLDAQMQRVIKTLGSPRHSSNRCQALYASLPRVRSGHVQVRISLFVLRAFRTFRNF
jgi:serine/threonine protein kinase